MEANLVVVHDHPLILPHPILAHRPLLDRGEDQEVDDECNGNCERSDVKPVFVEVVEEVLVGEDLGRRDGDVDGDRDLRGAIHK